jgi:hypothetical protein
MVAATVPPAVDGREPADGRPGRSLAGTPDDASWIDTQLLTIAQASADLITAIAYASVTAYREDAVTTVATTSDIARAVDQAQYDDQTGPCLEALDTAAPTPVPDISATMRWPGFRDSASRLGSRHPCRSPCSPVAASRSRPSTSTAVTRTTWRR